VEDIDAIIGEDPLLLNPVIDDFLIPMNSPAANNGYNLENPEKDFYGELFSEPRSIGALEANPISASYDNTQLASFDIFPNPGGRQLTTTFILDEPAYVSIDLIAQTGQKKTIFHPAFHDMGVYKKSFHVDMPSGWYLVRMQAGEKEAAQSWLHVE